MMSQIQLQTEPSRHSDPISLIPATEQVADALLVAKARATGATAELRQCEEDYLAVVGPCDVVRPSGSVTYRAPAAAGTGKPRFAEAPTLGALETVRAVLTHVLAGRKVSQTRLVSAIEACRVHTVPSSARKRSLTVKVASP
jgi:hypothetical protein